MTQAFATVVFVFHKKRHRQPQLRHNFQRTEGQCSQIRAGVGQLPELVKIVTAINDAGVAEG
jgi:hypothetical protein